ncbi:hypothetical protein ACVRZD_03660 [Streptococcus hongkongensis]|nr:hypothetical protein NC01_07855 [Streptococcus uberis]
MPNNIIKNKKHNELDFVNIQIDQDVELFLDPTKLHSTYLSPIFNNSITKLHSFFLEVYRIYIEYGESEVRKVLKFSSECNLIHLGYSRNGSRGTGASEDMLFNFFKNLTKFNESERKSLLHPASIAIFVPKFAEDRTSDFLVSILKKEIIEYTLEQAKIHNLEISPKKHNFGSYWAYPQLEWLEIENFYVTTSTGKPVLLIPKCLVSQKYKFSTSDFVKIIIFPNKRNLDKYKGINGYYKNNSPKPATQKQLIDMEIRSPYLNRPDKWKTYAMDQLLKNHNWYSEYFKNMNHFSDNHILPDELLDKLTTE